VDGDPGGPRFANADWAGRMIREPQPRGCFFSVEALRAISFTLASYLPNCTFQLGPFPDGSPSSSRTAAPLRSCPSTSTRTPESGTQPHLVRETPPRKQSGAGRAPQAQAGRLERDYRQRGQQRRAADVRPSGLPASTGHPAGQPELSPQRYLTIPERHEPARSASGPAARNSSNHPSSDPRAHSPAGANSASPFWLSPKFHTGNQQLATRSHRGQVFAQSPVAGPPEPPRRVPRFPCRWDKRTLQLPVFPVNLPTPHIPTKGRLFSLSEHPLGAVGRFSTRPQEAARVSSEPHQPRIHRALGDIECPSDFGIGQAS